MKHLISKYLEQATSLEEFQEAPIAPEVAAVAESEVAPQVIEPVADAPVVEELPVPVPVPEVGELTAVEPSPVETPVEIADVPMAPMDVAEVVEAEAGSLDAESAAHVQQEILEQRADELIETQHALESYSSLLKQARGEISQQTAAFLRVGIKQAERVIGESRVSVGLESYDAGPRSDITRATISVEDVKEYANKAFEKLKEIIAKIIDAILGGIDNLVTGITKADNAVSKLEEALSAGGVFRNTGKKFTLANPGAVMANGKLRLNDTKSISGLAHFSSYAYPAAVKKYYENLAKILSGYNVLKGDAEATIDKLHTAIAPLDDIYTSSYEVFPGNMEVSIQADGVVYGMKPSGSAKEAPAEIEVTVSDPSKLRTNVKKMRDIVEIIKKARDEHEKIREGGEAIKKAVAKIEEQAAREDVDASSKEAARKVTQAALEMVRMANPRGREIIQYIARTVVAFTSVYARENAEHRSNAEE